MSDIASYTPQPAPRTRKDRNLESGRMSSFDKLTALIEHIRHEAPDLIAAIPGNALLAKLPNAADIATEWIETRNRVFSATTAEIEVPTKLLQRAAVLFTDSRQWSYIFDILHSMQTSKAGVAIVHCQVLRDAVGGSHRDGAVYRLLKDKSLFSRVIEPAENVTASGYVLAQARDPKAPSILSNFLSTDSPKSHAKQRVSPTEFWQHRNGLGLVGADCSERKKTEKLIGRFRVASVRMIVELGETWNRIRESMSRRWGHIDAAADGAGRLDQVSETQAVEIAERYLTSGDDEKTRAGQIASAVEYSKYVASDRDARIRSTKWRGGRIYLPGLSLRKAARADLFRCGGEKLASADVRGCYWWGLTAEIRRALMITRETQTQRESMKTTCSVENVERLLYLVSAGRFYKFIADKCGIAEEVAKPRINMLCLFNKNKLGGPEFEALEAQWPEVAGVIRRIRAQVGGTSTLSRFLNGLEGQLMNEPLRILANAGHAVVRIHDCLAVPEAAVMDAIAAIKWRAEERYGILPGLKAEYPDGRIVYFGGEIATDAVGKNQRAWKLAAQCSDAMNQLADRLLSSILGADLNALAG